jgi:PAS domain-containing protein
MEGGDTRYVHTAAATSGMTALQQTSFDAIRDRIAVFDRDLCLISWNSCFAAVADYAPEMLQPGVPLLNLLRGDIADPQEPCEGRRAEIAARMSAAIQRDSTPRRFR